MTSTLTSKGQITIPKNVRDQLSLKPGDQVEFRQSNRGVVLKRHVDVERMRAVIGCFKEELKDFNSEEWIEACRGPVELPPEKRPRKKPPTKRHAHGTR